MIWSDHDNPYGLYQDGSGKPSMYRFRHRHIKINTAAGTLNLPGWIVGSDALGKPASNNQGVIVHQFAPRFMAHWEISVFDDKQLRANELLPAHMSEPIPLDEISEEMLIDTETRNRWLEEAAAAVSKWRGDICEFLPEDVPDYDEQNICDDSERSLVYEPA